VIGYYDEKGRLVLLGDEENEETLDKIFGFDDDEEEEEEE
jgi:hypothetical protein